MTPSPRADPRRPELRAVPGAESVNVALYAVDPNAAKWDKATWDGGYWGAFGWQVIDCQITEAQTRWGATDEAGILSLVSAGELDISTYDPARLLDPTNAESPYYGAVRPGTPVRVQGLVPGPSAGSAYRAAVLATGPVGYWRLGAGFTDETGNHAGGGYGTPAPTSAPGLIPGDPDTARTFDGTHTQYATTASETDLGVGVAGGWSASVIVRPDSIARMTIINRIGTGQYDYDLRLDNGGIALDHWYNDGHAYDVRGYTSPDVYAPGVTRHIVATLDRATQSVRFYVDGVEHLNKVVTWTADPVRMTGYVVLGRFFTGGHGFAGMTDELAIWEHALTPAEVAELYAAGVAGGMLPVPPLTMPAGTGIIDDATYDLSAARGRIRAVDGIAYLAQAQVPDGTTLPNTMRARARAVVAAVGLDRLVPVEPEAPADPDVDPPVAAHDGIAAPGWEVIARAAEDSLTVVWLDPAGTLRFRSWGGLPDSGLNLGCPDADSADELWLAGLSTVAVTASAGPVRNRVRAYSAGTTWQPARSDAYSAAKYGPRPFDVARIVPDFATWADRILADRADAGLTVAVGEVRPVDVDELAALLAVDGPAILRVRDDTHGPVVDFEAGVIGATVAVTAAGWRWQMVTTVPRVEWEAVPPEPPIPPIPPPDPWHTETRTYQATKDALLALTSGGAKYGAGASTTLPVGGWSGWTYRSVVDFAAIPWTKVRAVKTATLHLRTTNQSRVGFGSSPKLELRRITASWAEGGSSSPSSGNSIVWPGPATTDAGKVTAAMPGGENVDKTISCTAIVRAWAPVAAGGSGAAQRGIMLREISSSQSYTTEVWPREQGTAGARPTLTLELEVFD